MGNWYAREGGSNNNGGDSPTIAPDAAGGGAAAAGTGLTASVVGRSILGSGSSGGGALTTRTTASATYVAGRLYVLSVAATRALGAESPTVSGAAGVPSFTQRATVAFGSSGERRVTVFSVVPTTTYTGTLTFTWANTHTEFMWQASEFVGADTTVEDGIVQTATNFSNSNQTSYTVNLAAFGSSRNATMGIWIRTDSTLASSGYTLLYGASTGNLGLMTYYRTDADTTVDATSASSSAWAGVGIEIKALPGFNQSHVGRAIAITSPLGGRWYRTIASVTDENNATLNAANFIARSMTTWAIGGAWADPMPVDSAPLSDGDTVWIAPGVYSGQAIRPKSMTGMTYLRGDVTGNATGVPGGEVRLRGTILLASSNYWTIRDLTVTDSATCVVMSGTTANTELLNLTLISTRSSRTIECSQTFGVVQNLLIDSCRVLCGPSGVSGAAILLSAPSSASGSDVNANVTVRNSWVCGGFNGNADGIAIQGGTGAVRTGGFEVYNCTVLNGLYNGIGVRSISGGSTSSVYPNRYFNNFIYGGGNGLAGSPFASVIADYNRINTQNAASGVAIGSNSTFGAGSDLEFSLAHEYAFGGVIRAFMEPYQDSRLLSRAGGSSLASNDIRGLARPFSGTGAVTAAVGAYEHANSAYRERTIVPTDGGEAIRIAGPGYQDFQLAVSSNLTPTVSVQARYDGTYTGILPQLWIVNGEEAGVASTSNTMTAGANTWEQISVGPLAVTSNGIVTVRVQSLATASNAMAYFGSFGLE